MACKIDTKSLIIGLLFGLVALLVLGASSGENNGIYQLSMAAVRDETAGSSQYVIYGRIHTGTGKIETWKYMLHTNNAIPHLGSNTEILFGPITKSSTN